MDGRTLWEDVSYDPIGIPLTVRLDGRAFHDAPEVAFRDRRRDNAAELAARHRLVYGWDEVTRDACGVAAEVAMVLYRAGWHGPLRQCDRGCAATQASKAFYDQLSVPAFPRAGVALARARQGVAQQGADDATNRPGTEWATATLTATEDGPLIDSDLDLVPLRRPPVYLATDVVPALGLGELIGRRTEKYRHFLSGLTLRTASTFIPDRKMRSTLSSIDCSQRETTFGLVLALDGEQAASAPAYRNFHQPLATLFVRHWKGLRIMSRADSFVNAQSRKSSSSY